MSDILVRLAVDVGGSTYAVATVTEPDWKTQGSQLIGKVGEAIDEAARKVLAAVDRS